MTGIQARYENAPTNHQPPGIIAIKATAKIDAGVCGFKTTVTAETRDGTNVELRIGSDCETIRELAGLIKARNPVNAFQELTPIAESVVLGICRPVLQKKGCCEACAVKNDAIKIACQIRETGEAHGRDMLEEGIAKVRLNAG